MDSWPPATTTSTSPARSIRPPEITASRPDRQTLFTVMAGTVIGRPAATAVCFAGFCPAPAWTTWPMRTYSTSASAIPDRSRAAETAAAPSSGAVFEARLPSSRPWAVRAAPTMTTSSGEAVGVFEVMVHLPVECVSWV